LLSESRRGMINHHPWKKSHSPLSGFALTAEFDRR
jgi:hypothetical protein